MKRILSALAALIILLSGTVSYSAGYSVIVIPSGLSGARSTGNFLGNTDIEEVLACKLIKCLETNNIAYAPTMSTLKISIHNNTNFVPKAVNPMNNIKIISKSYGVPKVIIVSAKIEVLSAAKQKTFWNKMELPVITTPESNLRIITTVTLYNTQTDEILWNNVFYKNINCIGNGINNYKTNDSKIGAVNTYYDKLSKKIIEEIKDSKETHAIMVITKPAGKKDSSESKKTQTKIIPTGSYTKTPAKKSEEQDKPTIKPVNLHNTPKANLNMHEDVKKPKRNTVFDKIKNNVRLKYDTVKQEYETNRIKKMELETHPVSTQDKQQEKKVIKDSIKQQTDNSKPAGAFPQKENIKSAKQTPEKVNKSSKPAKSKETTKNENIIPQNQTNPAAKPKKEKEDKTVNNTKQNNKYNNKTPEKRTETKTQENIKNNPAKQVKDEPKTDNNTAAKQTPDEVSVSQKIKAKYNNIKLKCKKIREERKTRKNIQKTENPDNKELLDVNDEIAPAENYILNKPRSNSRKYIPKFDSSVNDL